MVAPSSNHNRCSLLSAMSSPDLRALPRPAERGVTADWLFQLSPAVSLRYSLILVTIRTPRYHLHTVDPIYKHQTPRQKRGAGPLVCPYSLCNPLQYMCVQLWGLEGLYTILLQFNPLFFSDYFSPSRLVLFLGHAKWFRQLRILLSPMWTRKLRTSQTPT